MFILFAFSGIAGCFSMDSAPTPRKPPPRTKLPETSQEKTASLDAGHPEQPPRSGARPAAPEIAAPAIPAAPQVPTPLKVDGFRPASHVGPDDPSTSKPVTVVLHGNYDRPEWQCDTWKQVAGFYGWILCPRGVPTQWAPPEEDRWLYRGQEATQREIDAGLAALEDRYPSLVSRDGMVLVGFSLGAILAPGMVTSRSGMYSFLFLIEGGVDKIEAWHLRALKRAGVKGIGMAMSTGKYRQAAKTLEKRIAKRGIKTVFVDMRGAGHNYRSDFVTTGQKALARLVGADE
jgi:hypothetical protein